MNPSKIQARPGESLALHKFRPSTLAAWSAAYDTVDLEELERFELPAFRQTYSLDLDDLEFAG